LTSTAKTPGSVKDRPTLLMIGQGDPMDAGLRIALDRHGLFVEESSTADGPSAARMTAPDLVLLVGDAAKDGGRGVLEALGKEVATAVVPVALLCDEGGLDKRVLAFRYGAIAAVPRSASVDEIARRVAQLARELPDRQAGSAELGEATFDELVEVVTRELRSGILTVGRQGGGDPMRIVLGAGRPVADAVQEFVQKLRPLVSRAEPLSYEFHQDGATGTVGLLEGDGARSADLTVFVGLRLLLVDNDPSRADSLAHELRGRGATVAVTDTAGSGIERASGLDPEVVVMDAAGIEGPGFEVVRQLRRDVRLRWASILVAPWDELWPDPRGAPDVGRLAEKMLPLVAHDRALRERAEKESAFDARLESTGPCRLLRVLATLEGPFHVSVRSAKAVIEVDVAQGLVVGVSGARANGEPLEGTRALAGLLAMGSGRVHIERRANPSTANVMSPVDEALARAAQESSPIAPSIPPPSLGTGDSRAAASGAAKKRPFPDVSELGREPVLTEGGVTDSEADMPVPRFAHTTAGARPLPGRTAGPSDLRWAEPGAEPTRVNVPVPRARTSSATGMTRAPSTPGAAAAPPGTKGVPSAPAGSDAAAASALPAIAPAAVAAAARSARKASSTTLPAVRGTAVPVPRPEASGARAPQGAFSSSSTSRSTSGQLAAPKAAPKTTASPAAASARSPSISQQGIPAAPRTSAGATTGNDAVAPKKPSVTSTMDIERRAELDDIVVSFEPMAPPLPPATLGAQAMHAIASSDPVLRPASDPSAAAASAPPTRAAPSSATTISGLAPATPPVVPVAGAVGGTIPRGPTPAASASAGGLGRIGPKKTLVGLPPASRARAVEEKVEAARAFDARGEMPTVVPPPGTVEAEIAASAMEDLEPSGALGAGASYGGATSSATPAIARAPGAMPPPPPPPRAPGSPMALETASVELFESESSSSELLEAFGEDDHAHARAEDVAASAAAAPIEPFSDALTLPAVDPRPETRSSPPRPSGRADESALPGTTSRSLVPSSPTLAPARPRSRASRAIAFAMLTAAVLAVAGVTAMIVARRMGVDPAAAIARLAAGGSAAPASDPAPDPSSGTPTGASAAAPAPVDEPTTEATADLGEGAPQAAGADQGTTGSGAGGDVAAEAAPATSEVEAPSRPPAEDEAAPTAEARPASDPAPAAVATVAPTPEVETATAATAADEAAGGTAGSSDPASAAEALVARAAAAPPVVAEALYRRALEADPQSHYAMIGLARLLLARGAAPEALPFARDAVRRRSRRAAYRVLLGDILLATGDASGAREAWEAALAAEPDSREAQRRLAR
jgi:DNA-binding response OmpR family regulator